MKMDLLQDDNPTVEELLEELSVICLDEDVAAKEEHDLLRKSFEERLQTNAHYFIGWFGEETCRMNQEQVEGFLKVFFAINKSPRTKAQLEKREFKPSKSYEDILGFFVEAYVIAGVRKRLAVKAFHLCEKAKSYAIDLVAQGMSPEYLPGVKYLHRWGQLYASILKGKLPKCDPSSYDGEAEFQKLSDKSKALVLGAKCNFMSTWRKISTTDYEANYSLTLLREIVDLDPTCYEWHYHLGNWLRHARRRKGTASMVSEEEEQALWETYEKCDYVKIEAGRNSRLRNKAFAGILQAIAENLKVRKINRMFGPVKFGDLKFSSDAEAAEFIVQDIKRMIREERENNGCASFSELIRAGEMLSSLLPENFRDLKAAEKYYLEAMKLKSNNSKLHHKLGILYLTTPDPEMHSIPKSLEHLRKAWEVEHANIPGGIDLIKTLMSDALANRNEISEIFSSLLESNKLTDNDRRQICFAKGCFHYALGEKDDAIKRWIESVELDKGDAGHIMMNTLGGAVKRYRWDANKYPFADILAAAESYEKAYSGSLKSDELRALGKLKNSHMLRIRRYFESGQGDRGIFRGRGRAFSMQRGPRGGAAPWRGGRGGNTWTNNPKRSNDSGGVGESGRVWFGARRHHSDSNTSNWRSRDDNRVLKTDLKFSK